MNYEIKKMDGKKVLVIGGLGFIGSNLVHKLVDLDAEVTIYDACLNPYGWNKNNIKEIETEVAFVKGDVRDFDQLKEHIKEKDFIFNFAAQVGRSISMADPYLDTTINCVGTLNVVEACRRFNDTAKILNAGTRGVIGEPEYLPVDEKHPTNPTDIYGINKLAAEKYCLVYNQVYGIPAVSLRLNNVFGPRCQMKQSLYGILNWFIRNCMLGEKITVYGDGNQTRDYVYIDDVVDAFLLAAQSKNADKQIFMVGSGEETKFIDMVQEVIKGVGKGECIHVPFPEDIECIDIKRFVSSNKKINEMLGWYPNTSFEDGIKETVEFYEKNLKYYR